MTYGFYMTMRILEIVVYFWGLVPFAKKMFVAVGPEDTIYQAIAKDDNSIRNTQIKSKILKRYKERDEKS